MFHYLEQLLKNIHIVSYCISMYLSVAAPLPLSMLLLSTILLFVVVDVVDAVRFHVLSLMLLVSFVSSFGRRLPTTKHCPADGF